MLNTILNFCLIGSELTCRSYGAQGMVSHSFTTNMSSLRDWEYKLFEIVEPRSGDLLIILQTVPTVLSSGDLLYFQPRSGDMFVVRSAKVMC